LYSNKGDNDRAIADYTEVIKLDPKHTDAYNNRGNAYYNKNNYDQAIADYTEAIRLNPKFADAYNNRGNAYLNKNDYNRAIADYNEALRLNPNHNIAKNNLALARQRQSQSSAQQKPAAQQGSTASGKTYKIGDTGPAGGIVFYDKGTFSDGWRYLEAAPAETEFGAQWGLIFGQDGNYISVNGTEGWTGSGKRNTQLIVAAFGAEAKRTAAYQCANLNFNGFKDWFLPSINELGLMYTNLKRQGLGNFSGHRYWSSSEADSGQAYYYTFQYDQSGETSRASKHYVVHTRAVRAF